jgi:hypothetical protein
MSKVNLLSHVDIALELFRYPSGTPAETKGRPVHGTTTRRKGILTGSSGIDDIRRHTEYVQVVDRVHYAGLGVSTTLDCDMIKVEGESIGVDD